MDIIIKNSKANPFATESYNMIKSFAILYILILASYLPSLFTCYEDNLFKNNIFLIHIVGFFVFYFLVTLTDESLKDVAPTEKLIISFFYFIIFLITTRMDIRITFAVIILIFIIHFINLNEEHYEKQKKDKKDTYWLSIGKPINIKYMKMEDKHMNDLNIVKKVLYYTLIILIVIGFIAYGGEIKEQLKGNNKISWFNILMRRDICRIKGGGLINNLKVGLGIK